MRGPGQKAAARVERRCFSLALCATCASSLLLLVLLLLLLVLPQANTAQASSACATCTIKGSVNGRPFTSNIRRTLFSMYALAPSP